MPEDIEAHPVPLGAVHLLMKDSERMERIATEYNVPVLAVGRSGIYCAIVSQKTQPHNFRREPTLAEKLKQSCMSSSNNKPTVSATQWNTNTEETEESQFEDFYAAWQTQQSVEDSSNSASIQFTELNGSDEILHSLSDMACEHGEIDPEAF